MHIPRLLILPLLLLVRVAPLAAHPMVPGYVRVCSAQEAAQPAPTENYFPRPVLFQQLPASAFQNGVSLAHMVAPPEFHPHYLNPFRTRPLSIFPVSSCRRVYLDAREIIVNGR